VYSWLSSREWSVYPFLPSIISIIISLGGTRHLTQYLKNEVYNLISDPKQAKEVINIAVTWNLKLQVVASYFSTFLSWWVIFKNHVNMLLAGWIILGLLGFLSVLLPVLISPLGTLNEELVATNNSSYLENYLARKKITYAVFYSWILISVHCLLLGAIFFTLPAPRNVP